MNMFQYFQSTLATLRSSSSLNRFARIARLGLVGLTQPYTIQRLHTVPPLAKGKKPWDLGKINHVALVTPDLDKSAALYRDVLGATVSGKQELPEHGVTTVFVELGDTKIELLHPLGEKSPIQSFLDKNKSGGMHHICIEVDNITEALKDLKSHNIRLLSKEPRIGAHGKPVMFLHPKDCDGVLVELEEA